MEKEKVLKLIFNTYGSFKYNFGRVIAFEIIYKLVTFAIFLPLIGGILTYFIGSTGRVSLANKEFLRFALTPVGFLCILILVVIAFLIIFFEIGVLIHIGAASHEKRKVTLSESVINTFRIVPKLLNRNIVPLTFLTGVIGPMTGVGLCSTLIRNFTIPPFVTIELSKTLGGKILYNGLILFMVILMLRWILAIPAAFIEEGGAKGALGRSKNIYKKNRWKFIKLLVSWPIILYIGGALTTGIFVMGGYLVYNLPISSGITNIILAILFVIFFVIFVLFSLGTTPLFIAFLVELYYEFRDYKCIERTFKSNGEYLEYKWYKKIVKYSKPITIGLCIAVISFIGIYGFSTIYNMSIKSSAKVTAHRGSSIKAPENSIASIKLAIDEKADFAEIDVMSTRDGGVVLFHDSNLKRISKREEALQDLTLEEVTKIDNGSYFSSEFSEERIPTLEKVLKISKGKINLNIELKPIKGEKYLEEEVIRLVRKYKMEDEVVITSMEYDSLEKIKKIAPELKTGYIVMALFGDIEAINVDFFSVESTMAKPSFIYGLHALGKEVHVWTVNNIEEAERLLALGVDNIITDNVPLISNLVLDNDGESISNSYTNYYEAIIIMLKYIKI